MAPECVRDSRPIIAAISMRSGSSSTRWRPARGPFPGGAALEVLQHVRFTTPAERGRARGTRLFHRHRDALLGEGSSVQIPARARRSPGPRALESTSGSRTRASQSVVINRPANLQAVGDCGLVSCCWQAACSRCLRCDICSVERAVAARLFRARMNESSSRCCRSRPRVRRAWITSQPAWARRCRRSCSA